MDTGTPPENAERSRVRTITITAPQQEHRIGARSFTQAIETCHACGGTVKVIACIEDPVVIQKILTHIDPQEPRQ